MTNNNLSDALQQPLNQTKRLILPWIGVISLVYLLITAVSLISLGFKLATGNQAEQLFAFATNPFAGLIVGILATTFIQSSSTVTSIIVALVAGGLPVTVAVPMIMGSNVGTTITNTLVSLGHISNKEEFRKAFAAATIHDFFNILSVIIFLPLEMATHVLEKIAFFLSNFLIGGHSLSINNFNFIDTLTTPLVNLFREIGDFFPTPFAGIFLILLGIILIFISILYIGKLLKILMGGKSKTILKNTIGQGSFIGILSGTIITILVQSSSTTTSLVVPLAGTGLLTLEEIYPFTLGANIGTCITALLAATAITSNQVDALEIAMVHLSYNVLGVFVIFGIPLLRKLPILGAKLLADIASEKKYIAFIYMATVFLIIPAILLGLTSGKP